MKVQQRVQLHCALVLTKLRPRKQSETEIDGSRIEGIKAAIQNDTHRVFPVERSGDRDQVLSKIGKDTPVMSLVGVSQSGTDDSTPETHVIELAIHGPEARLNVAQAFAISELSEGHCQILIPAGEFLEVSVAAIAGNALLELDVGEVTNQLSENSPASI